MRTISAAFASIPIMILAALFLPRIADAQMTLPYAGADSSPFGSASFSVTNTGHGTAAYFEGYGTSGANVLHVLNVGSGPAAAFWNYTSWGDPGVKIESVCSNFGDPACSAIYATTSNGEAIWARGTIAGVHGESETYGIYGFTANGTAVRAQATGSSSTGTGLHATSSKGLAALIETYTGGTTALKAQAYNANPSIYGLNVNNGQGVVGESTTQNGVMGKTAAAGVSGVYGENMAGLGYGVAGRASGSGTAVYGDLASPTTGYAGYFRGRVHVNDVLSKSSGTFKIDHPLDPTNKYLSHSFVESPDMKNLYGGVVVLDSAGEPWVPLPLYFEALNRDFRYQLTCIGQSSPVYVKSEVVNNKFQVAGGKPGQKVSWQVTGTRKDAFALQNPVIVEEPKTAPRKGKYLNPTAYGKSESEGEDFGSRPVSGQ